MNQIDDVFSYLGVSGTPVGGWWLGIEGDGNVASYVSVADNLSNDPIFDGGVQIAGAAPPGPTPTPTSPPATPSPTPTSPPTTPTPTPTSPPAGACVSVPALADGSRFNVDTTAVINGSTFTGSGVVDVVSTTATGDDRDSHYELQPLNMVIDISQQRQFHVEGEFRVLEQNHTYTALTLNGASQPGYPSEVTTDYDPARVDEPTSFCTGATWQVPSVSQTVVTNGGAADRRDVRGSGGGRPRGRRARHRACGGLHHRSHHSHHHVGFGCRCEDRDVDGRRDGHPGAHRGV